MPLRALLLCASYAPYLLSVLVWSSLVTASIGTNCLLCSAVCLKAAPSCVTISEQPSSVIICHCSHATHAALCNMISSRLMLMSCCNGMYLLLPHTSLLPARAALTHAVISCCVSSLVTPDPRPSGRWLCSALELPHVDQHLQVLPLLIDAYRFLLIDLFMLFGSMSVALQQSCLLCKRCMSWWLVVCDFEAG